MQTTTTATIKKVYIPACKQHEGFYGVSVRVDWNCPICGEPRGEVDTVRDYDGSRILFCDGWQNPCGHLDTYSDVLDEAMRNGLNWRTAGTD